MAQFAELKFQPGIRRGSTDMPSAGWYFDSQLVRQPDFWLRPMQGWQLRSSGASALTGTARAITAWRANNGNRWIAIGTNSKLYVQSQDGVNTDITPSGFTAGSADATTTTGWGAGTWGGGFWGVDQPDGGAVTPAACWTLDTWGEYLVGCSNADGKIYQWTLNTASAAAVLSNAPTSCQGIVVTDERILMALAAGGNARKVQWSDQENNNTWTPSTTNQAGDFELKTVGQLMAGKTLKGGTLLFTTVDAWIANYVGYPLVYGFERVGVGCGLIAPQAAVQIDDVQAAWMTKDNFWVYNGYAQPIPSASDIRDYVFSNINTAQVSKCSAVHQAAYGEVWWFYPSSSSNECDRYVLWCYRTDKWWTGALSRTCGVDKGVFINPLMVGADGLIYAHETGFDYTGADLPYAESGPIELSPGDYMMEVSRYIPDDKTLGNATLTLYGKTWPNGAESTYGPATVSEKTDFLFQTRLLRVRYNFAGTADDRIGIPKIAYTQGDMI